MRRFQIHRDVDVSGVSGTGIVAEGVQFATGKVAVHWLGDYPSIATWDSIDHAEHIHGHAGMSRFVWLDDESGLMTMVAKNAPPYRVNRFLQSTEDVHRFGWRMSDGTFRYDDEGGA